MLEDEIPDLDEARAEIGTGVAGTACVLGACVVEDLGARAARTGRTHRPEIVGVEARDLGARHPDLALPQLLCFVVVDVNGGVEFLRRQLDALDQILPRPKDRFALVVVAEREIAEHLEEGAVPAGAADVLDVVLPAGDAQAALHGDDPRRRRRHVAQERRDELLHPRDREQRRRHRVGDQGRGRDVLVSLRDEKVDERAAQFLALHKSTASIAAATKSVATVCLVALDKLASK